MRLEDLVLTFSYIGIFSVVFAETGLLLGFALPGDSWLIVIGILAASHKIALAPSLLALFLGSFLGNNLGYWLGKALGPGLKARVKPKDYQTATWFMARFGFLALLIGPYVPVVRTLVPFVCGATRMPWYRFAILTFFGSLLWTQGLTLLAYFVGTKIPNLEQYVYLIVAGGALAALVLGGLSRLIRRLKK
ncbi:MAG: DedA family protein [Deinococcus sp.]|nr:DedA family protein [Deinococcus sp.]